jgi:hypothetical protein
LLVLLPTLLLLAAPLLSAACRTPCFTRVFDFCCCCCCCCCCWCCWCCCCACLPAVACCGGFFCAAASWQ